MRIKTLAPVTATLSLGLLLTACGSSGVTVSSASPTTTTTTTTTTSSASPTTTMETSTSTESPMTSDTPTTETSTSTESSTSESTPAPSLTSPDAIHKAAFLKIVKQRYPELSETEALSDGTFVCQQMAQSKGLLSIIGDLQDKHSKWTTQQAGFFLGLSVGALCSEYTSKISSN